MSEDKLIETVSKLELRDGDVLVFRGFKDPSAYHFARSLQSCLNDRNVVLMFLQDGQIMERMDEDQMKEAGWVRSNNEGIKRSVLQNVEDAMRANNGMTDIKFNESHCTCDHSVGMAPCQYCAIHRALEQSREFITKFG